MPDRSLCTDNAAMIASAARFGPRLAYPGYLGLDAYATGETGLARRGAPDAPARRRPRARPLAAALAGHLPRGERVPGRVED